jgi:hypothetical protein
MLETYVKHNRTQAAYRTGLAGPYLDDFTLWLQKQGYRHDTIRRRIPGASQFVSWAQSRGYHVQDLNAERLEAFRHDLATCGQLLCASGNHTARYLAAKLFLAFVQAEGIASAPDVASVMPP